MKLLTFIILFIFNTLYIDSNSSKRLIYDINDNYDNKLNTVYFIDLNTNDLQEKINIFDIQILSYIIGDKKYYARNIEKLKEQFFKDKTLEEKIYYETYGIKIDALNIMCTNNELMKLDTVFGIY